MYNSYTRRNNEIYVATMEALKKNKRQNDVEFTTKIDGSLYFTTMLMLMYFFARFFSISPCA
jgi:hypothetical protein